MLKVGESVLECENRRRSKTDYNSRVHDLKHNGYTKGANVEKGCDKARRYF